MRRRGLPILTLLAFSAGPTAAAQAQLPPTTTPPSAGRISVSDTSAYRVAGRNVALAGQVLRVRGTVSPYVAGQTVMVNFVRGASRLGSRHAVVTRSGGKGVFTVFFRAPKAGALHVEAVHAATAAQVAMRTTTSMILIAAGAGPGNGGLRVRYLQTRLASLGYLTTLGGHYDGATERAVVAFHKVTSMPRTSFANVRTYFKLAAGQGRFRARFPWHGRHVEVSISRQVLALFYPGGQVYKVIPVSTGKPSTPTVRGSFSVFSKTPGYNSLGMLDSNYFADGGFAIHGYPEVPTYAASHGCVRAPIPNAGFLFNWIQHGTRVDVYG